MNLIPWHLAKSDASHQEPPAPTQLCDGYTTPHLVLHLTERLEHLPIHTISSFVSIILKIPNLQEFHILHQRIQQEAPRVCGGNAFYLLGIQSICLHKVVPQSPQKYEVTMLPESTGLLNFFGIPRFQLQGIAVDEKVGAEHAPSDFPADDAVAYSLSS